MDSELVTRWRRGDERAGRILFDRYFDPLYRFFCNKVDDGVDDLIQETLLACVQGRDNIRDDASFRTYVFSVARNRLYKRWRRHERKGSKLAYGLTSIVDFGVSPSGVASRNERAHRLLEALRQIPANLQVVLELHYWEDASASEIAAIVGIPEGTARSRLRRGREALARELRRGAVGTPDVFTEDNLQRWAATLRGELCSR